MDLIAPGNGILYWQIATSAAALGYFCFTIYALVDLIRSDFKEQHIKLIWALMILFLPIAGTFLYLNMSKSTKRNFRKFTPDFSTQQTNK